MYIQYKFTLNVFETKTTMFVLKIKTTAFVLVLKTFKLFENANRPSNNTKYLCKYWNNSGQTFRKIKKNRLHHLK